MSLEVWMELGIIVALTLTNGLFAAVEVALLTVRRTRLKELADRGSAQARAALALRSVPERFLATVQIGITVIAASTAVFGGARLEAPIARAAGRVGLTSHADAIAFVVVVAIVSFLSLVLGELVPKSLALRWSERFALLSAPVLLVLATLVKPLVWLLTVSSNLILRPFGDRTTFTESRLSPNELQQVIDESATGGALSATAGEIASRAIDLSHLSIGAMMIPKRLIVSLPANAPRPQISGTLRDKPHARYPVLGIANEIVGYVLTREIYEHLANDEPVDLRKLARSVPFVRDDVPAVSVLRQLQSLRQQMAIVVDRSGSVAGLVTIEDIAEALLGDILEEHELPEPLVHREPTGAFLVRGDTPVHEIEQVMGLKLAGESSVRTIGAVIAHRLGHVPLPGERVPLADDAIEAEVTATSKRRIREVRIRRCKRDEERHA